MPKDNRSQQDYQELLTKHLPRPITSLKEHKRAEGIIRKLVAIENPSDDECDMLHLFLLLIDDFERQFLKLHETVTFVGEQS